MIHHAQKPLIAGGGYGRGSPDLADVRRSNHQSAGFSAASPVFLPSEIAFLLAFSSSDRPFKPTLRSVEI
jgi:hypothetical protein